MLRLPSNINRFAAATVFARIVDDNAAVVSTARMSLDIGLPDRNGTELAKRLWQGPETATAVLIALTGYGQEQDRAKTKRAGVDH